MIPPHLLHIYGIDRVLRSVYMIKKESNTERETKMTTITLHFRFIEGGSKTKKYKTLAGAAKAAQHQIGRHPSIGSSYAVDDYGCCTISAVGCTLEDLFPAA